jgi:hypothetical protein
MIYYFYGMSGTLKATTIGSPRYEEALKIWSDIKPYWNYRKTLFPEELPGTDGDFIIQRLIKLNNYRELITEGELSGSKDICIERGVSDMIKCMIDNGTFKGEDKDIYKIIEEEGNIFPIWWTTRKILLVMLDEDFIENRVLNEINRLRYYPDLETYLKRQEEYVEFTKRYNHIDEVIEIRNAYDYIESLNYK